MFSCGYVRSSDVATLEVDGVIWGWFTLDGSKKHCRKLLSTSVASTKKSNTYL